MWFRISHNMVHSFKMFKFIIAIRNKRLRDIVNKKLNHFIFNNWIVTIVIHVELCKNLIL